MASQKPPEISLSNTNFLPEIFERSPTFTSVDAGWSNIALEAFCLPPGETPEFCLDHYVISINVGQKVQAHHILEGKRRQATFFQGTVAMCPIHSRHSFHWASTLHVISLHLKPELLHLNAVEALEKDRVELIPNFGIQDGLIHQIGLALQAELRSNNVGGRLYAETMANALAVHLLRNYSTEGKTIVNCNRDVSQHKLTLVIDYINDNLGHELSLKELAAIAQISQYHFCRAFKQMTGLSPHQYLIQQRVERAKQLLQTGEMSIGAVAIACGFAHQSHLHRHFKRLTGVTPKTFLNS